MKVMPKVCSLLKFIIIAYAIENGIFLSFLFFLFCIIAYMLPIMFAARKGAKFSMLLCTIATEGDVYGNYWTKDKSILCLMLIKTRLIK